MSNNQRVTPTRARRIELYGIGWLACLALGLAPQDLPIITDVDFQPLASQALRVNESMQFLGAPFSEGDRKALEAACRETDAAKGVRDIQRVLDPHVLIFVNINPESRVKVAAGQVRPELQEQGWRTFLVKVHNEAGVTAQLKAESPNAAPLYTRSTSSPDPFGKVEPKKAVAAEKLVKPGDVSQRFLDIAMYDSQPLTKNLSGLKVEYRIIQLYTRDAGKREASISFNVGQGTQDIGFRSAVPILFDCLPSTEVVLGVIDSDGSPTMGAFVFRDKNGRVYPSPARRLAPDFFFHPQIYRANNESIHLPPGRYDVEYTRGPEYLVEHRTIDVPESVSHKETFRLKRWIQPAKMGWYSGDHHVHAAGCAHYETPMEGVLPKDMMRHILGEDLNVGCVLSWGPCWYFQKQFFEGKVHELSTPDYVMRYDVEVSGFPSSHAGHLCLLRLKEDDYTPPGGEPVKYIDDWPSWDLPVLQWGKRQGGVVGFSHSGWGLNVDTAELPNYVIPPMNGIGANEYLVDVAHDSCDFISSVDTPYVWELNIWYHTLNCGFRAKLSGETDFPCIYGERVGLGRIYIKQEGALDFDKWTEGIKQGRSYVGDGRSHLMDFTVNNFDIGTGEGELRLDRPGPVKVRVKAAAYLPEQQTPEGQAIQSRSYDQKPYWDIERSRIGKSRKVPVEVVVNGYPVKSATKEMVADGTLQDLEFEVPIDRSSWIALRILPSAHTNPIFVLVDDKPIHASRRSADWCIKSIDQCWKQKVKLIRDSEKETAKRAYDEARAIYERILVASEVE